MASKPSQSDEEQTIGLERPDASGAGRAPRALGRGLADVSHLFLSGADAPVGEPEADHALREPTRRPDLRRGLGVLRPGVDVAKHELTATLFEYGDALEPGLQTLGSDVSCSPFGEIDVLAVDGSNRLTIVDVDTKPGDQLLLRGLGHIDWVTRNVTNLQRMYPAAGFAGPPRLLLVAPSFSLLLMSAIRHLDGPAARCFVYHTVAMADRTAIFIEPLRGQENFPAV